MSDQDPLLGAVLAETYIITSLLGEGGMGRVYLASHTRIDAKRFAVKVLNKEFAGHHEALERFKREAEAAALIAHPNVTGVHDVGQTPDGRPFLVSDFLEGEELAELLERESQLAVGEAVRIVRQICAGLGAAHARGVVHRDVKPENVFLVGPRATSIAKLLDFGVSRLSDSGGKALTQAGVALGTPDYMSPEQARGKKTIDHRTDIYSTGVMLYGALTGVMPFERELPHDTLIALLTEAAPPLRDLEAAIPEQLDLIVQKAMAKEVNDRYQAIDHLYEALAPFDPTNVASPASPTHTAPVAIAQPIAQPVAQPVAQPIAQPAPLIPVAPTTSPRDGYEARAAHRRIVTYGVIGTAAVVSGVLLAVAGVIEAADLDLGSTGWAIVVLILLSILATPVGVGTHHIMSNVWGSSARAVKAARSIRVPVLAGAAAYGLATLLVRSWLILADNAGGWPLADVVVLVVSGAAAAIAALTAPRS
jgi:hypothetical protein